MSAPVRILLVEDNPGDADLTKETLESGTLPLEVAWVVDGTKALEYLMKQAPYSDAPTPDLIVLDLNLPKLDGRGVLAEIKKHAALRKIPVVILTSSDAPRDVEESYGLGANCYVTKPVGLNAYRQIVHSVERFWLNVARLP